MQLEATMLTLEDRPITISFSLMPTPGALLRGVTSIYKADGDTLSQSLIFNKALEHRKSPAMDLSIALPSEVNPISDMSQFLKDDNRVIQCSSIIDYPLTDPVKHIPMEAVFSSAKPFESMLSTTSAFALKGTLGSEVVVSTPVKPTSLKELISGSNSNILNPQVNSDNLIGRSRRGNKFLNNKMQIEGSVSIDKVSRTKLPGLILQIASLVVPKREIATHTMTIGGKSAVGRFNSACSGIIANRSKVKIWFRAFSFKTGFHCFSYLITRRASEVCREIKQFSGLIVNFVVKSNFVSKFLFPGNIANPVAGIGICLHCLKKKVVVLRKNLYLHCSGYLLHSHILVQYLKFVKYLERRKGEFLHQLKLVVSFA